MRTLKVTQTYFPYLSRGGRPAVVRDLARHLGRRGHRITVLTADLGPGVEGVSGKSDTGIEEVYLRTVARYRVITLNPEVWRFCNARLRDFDVVHIYGLYDLLGSVVAWFCRRWAIPYVVEPLGMYRPIVRSIWKKRLYHRLLGRALVDGAARLIATSDQERQELIEGGVPAEKVAVRRNGLDMSEFERLPARGTFRREMGLSEGEHVVLYLGRLSRVKGLDLLLRAFADLSVPARLVIVGPDDRDGCVQELERLQSDLGLQDQVMLTGPRFGIQKLEAFVDADLFVLPSQNENFGNVAMEAAACGVPVIVTDRCGVAPYIQDRSGLVVPYSVGPLTRALHQLLTDRALSERFRANAVHIRRELSWEQPVAVQEQIYQAVLAQADKQA